jgi:hypothetical protein
VDSKSEAPPQINCGGIAYSCYINPQTLSAIFSSPHWHASQKCMLAANYDNSMTANIYIFRPSQNEAFPKN